MNLLFNWLSLIGRVLGFICLSSLAAQAQSPLSYGAYQCTDKNSVVMRLLFRDKSFISIIKEMENGKLVLRGIYTGKMEFNAGVLSMQGYGVKRATDEEYKLIEPPLSNKFQITGAGDSVEMSRVHNGKNENPMKCVLTKNKEMYENADKLRASIPREMFNDWTNLDVATTASITPLLKWDVERQDKAKEDARRAITDEQFWTSRVGRNLKESESKQDALARTAFSVVSLENSATKAAKLGGECKQAADKIMNDHNARYPIEFDSATKISKGNSNHFVFQRLDLSLRGRLKDLFFYCPAAFN